MDAMQRATSAALFLMGQIWSINIGRLPVTSIAF
jgi:hypothetical protein